LNNHHEDLSPNNDPASPLEPQNLAPQPSTLHKIFIGADGLRAGWSILVFIALLAAFLKSVSALNHIFHLLPTTPPENSEAGPSFLFASELIPFLATFLITWLMSKIEKRPASVYGLGGNRKLPHFIAGLAWGVSCLSLLILTLLKTGLLVIDSRLIFGGSIFRYGALWLLGFFLVGLLEEYLTRGYLLYTLTRGLAGFYRWAFKTRHSAALGFWSAAFILSFLFGFSHGKNPGESPIGLLSAGLASIVFCLSLWRTGSLWWAIGFHTSWDWGQSFLYGVADSGLMVKFHLLATHPAGKPILSGGTTGPEGSVFILPVLFLIAVIIIFTLPHSSDSYAELLPAGPQPSQA
jgi:uncharacterized protein